MTTAIVRRVTARQKPAEGQGGVYWEHTVTLEASRRLHPDEIQQAIAAHFMPPKKRGKTRKQT